MSTRRLFGAEPEHHQFYRNSFKQLSDIQQRQVGMLLGAAVADAATRSYELMDVADAQEALRSVPVSGGDEETAASRGDLEIAFLPLQPTSNALQSLSYQHTSTTGAMYYELLKVMMAARGVFSVEDVAPRWVAVASGRREEFQAMHGRLIHTVPLLSTLPCVYPYADDDALWDFASPYAAFLAEPLTTTPSPLSATNSDAEALADGPGRAASLADFAASHASVMAVQSVALRYLQCNPDPLRNAAFQCKPGGAMVFPDDVRLHCPQAGDATGDTGLREGGATDQLQVRDTAAIMHALAIARRSKSFAHGIREVIRSTAARSTPAAVGGCGAAGASLRCCGPAMLVGALLGARFGVRNVPLEWISATRDHHAIGTMCIEVCQWAWNPSSR